MGERLRRIWHPIAAGLSALWRLFARLLVLLGHALRKHSGLLGLAQGIRARERRRRDGFENLGRMVFLLYKRNLVRNPDLLAECEKIVALEAELDRLAEQVDQTKARRPPPAASKVPEVAATPLDSDRLVVPDAADPLAAQETSIDA